jgi:hypothetical protein
MEQAHFDIECGLIDTNLPATLGPDAPRHKQLLRRSREQSEKVAAASRPRRRKRCGLVAVGCWTESSLCCASSIDWPVRQATQAAAAPHPACPGAARRVPADHSSRCSARGACICRNRTPLLTPAASAARRRPLRRVIDASVRLQPVLQLVGEARSAERQGRRCAVTVPAGDDFSPWATRSGGCRHRPRLRWNGPAWSRARATWHRAPGR